MQVLETHIEPLVVNGLRGRLLHIPASGKGKKQTVLIYGIHSSHERMYSMALFLSEYGSVTMPDLPGIGGMDSFYSIGRKPTLDEYADYLYTVLKTRGLQQQVTIVAMSFGFLVVTRMLQRHEDARGWFDDIISFVGFGRSTDFKDVERRRKYLVPLCRLLSTRLMSWLVRILIFNRLSLRVMFGIFRLFNPKYKHALKHDKAAADAMELDLWRKNDARTRFAIYYLFFTFDLTRGATKLPLHLHDMTTPTDQYFDPAKVNGSLRLLYETVSTSEANMPLHAPSIIGSVDDVRTIFSANAKRILGK